VSFQDSAGGSKTITATYQGDALHFASPGTNGSVFVRLATTLTQYLDKTSMTYGETGTITGDSTGIAPASVVISESRLNPACNSGSVIGSDSTDTSDGTWGPIPFKPSGLSTPGNYFLQAAFATTPQLVGSMSTCDQLTVTAAPTYVVGVSATPPGPITTLQTSSVNYKVESGYGIAGDKATGTVSVVQDTNAPDDNGGTLTCTGNGVGFNVDEADATTSGESDDGFGVTGTITGCGSSTPGTYKFHVHNTGNSNYAVDDSDFLYLTVVPPNTAPVIAWAEVTGEDTHPDSADEGDVVTYTFTITDPDADTWDYASLSPQCGDHGSVDGTPSIDQTNKTGTFDCKFLDGPNNSTVSVTVNDGTVDSNELTQGVAIANVKPVVTNSLTGSGSVACQGITNSVTLGFSWIDPAGTNDTYDYVVNWGDGSTTPSNGTPAPGATSPQTGFTHSYAAGTYTIIVTVNDEDPGAGGTKNSSVSFLYSTGQGILQPVNPGPPNSIFKYGSTIPVKIQLTDCNGAAVGGQTLHVGVEKFANNTPPGVTESVDSSGQSNTGDLFRYDTTAKQYIYNLSTKVLCPDPTAGYKINISGPTIANVTANFGLKS
jgi:hypothetical protein